MISRKKLITTIIVITVVVLLTVYALIACLPYSGGVKVKDATKQDFSYDAFLGAGTGSERVRILDEPQEAFRHRIELIEAAESELIFSSYACHEGYTYDVFFGALMAAADRGVKIGIILDAKFGGLDGGTKKMLRAHQNITLYEYNPLNIFKPHNLNVCLHDKYLISDGGLMIFGGRNIGDKYYGPDSYTGGQSLDREILVYNAAASGGSISEVREYFGRVTAAPMAKKASSVKSTKKTESRKASLIAAYEAYTSSQKLPLDYPAITLPAGKISLVANPTSGQKKEPVVAYNMYMLAKNSGHTIMQSPYIILTKENTGYLGDIAESTGGLTLLTNSLASTPNPGYSNYYVNRKKILSTGAQVFEYQDTKHSIHAKTMIFGDRLTAIGSFNLDERSIRIDTETMLVIDSTEVNAAMRDVLDGYLNKSLQVDNESAEYLEGAVEPAKVSGGKKALYNVIGFFANAVKYLL